MDTAAFLAAVPSLFEGDPLTTFPADPRWVRLTEQVEGMTGPNELAVLALAASMMGPDEVYLEVGTYKGRSLCAAVQGAPGARVYAVENFMEFGMAGQEAKDELRRNLAEHATGARWSLIEGDCFDVLRPGVVEGPVGVYFFDGEHTGLSHYLALAVIEPLLADEALVLVDDASWPIVQRAHRRFLARHPHWQEVARWDAAQDEDPRWSNGLHALVYRRPPGADRRLAPVDTALRAYQATVQKRVNRTAWTLARRAPWVKPLLLRLVSHRGRSVQR